MLYNHHQQAVLNSCPYIFYMSGHQPLQQLQEAEHLEHLLPIQGIGLLERSFHHWNLKLKKNTSQDMFG